MTHKERLVQELNQYSIMLYDIGFGEVPPDGTYCLVGSSFDGLYIKFNKDGSFYLP